VPKDRTHADACPGAIDVHPAADGGLARIRIPGGTLTKAQFRAIVTASADLGDGQLELTSRANFQIRGLAEGAQFDLGDRMAEAGLLPSLTHERVRNIIAAPLSDTTQAVVDRLDDAICATPELADLPGRFLITVGAEVAGLGGDIGLVDDALLLAGSDTGLRPANPVEAVVRAARIFAAERGSAWRLAEVPDLVARITAALGTPTAEPLAIGVTPPPPGPAGDRFVVGAPLGRLDAHQAAALADFPVRLTPWRSLVLPGSPDLTGLGLITDPDSPWHGVTACTGRPGCAKSLADVRADARNWLGTPHTRPVHWAGCARRCGRPSGDVIEFVATGDGYEETS
jgi:precorrin-3B synthase